MCAVKRVRKPNVAAGLDEEGADGEEALEEFRVEVELMKSLDHPSICRLLQVYEDPKNLPLGSCLMSCLTRMRINFCLSFPVRHSLIKQSSMVIGFTFSKRIGLI